jgi:hypothetical protein
MTNYFLHNSSFAGKTNCQARNEAASDEVLLFSPAWFRAGSISKINMMDGEIYLETKSIGSGVQSSGHNINGKKKRSLHPMHRPTPKNNFFAKVGRGCPSPPQSTHAAKVGHGCPSPPQSLFCCQKFASGFFEGKPRGELNQTQTTSTK